MGTFNRVAATLIINELLPRLRKMGCAIEDSPVPPGILACMAQLKCEGRLDTHSIRKILDTACQA